MNGSSASARVSLVMGFLLALGPFASAAELTAGDVDDNLNFEAYSTWANRLRQNQTSLPALNLTERVTVRVVDAAGSPVSRALVSITAAGEAQPRASLPAGTDGVLRFFPGIDAEGPARQFTLQASAPGGGATSPDVSLDLDAPPADRTVTLTVDGQVAAEPQALDFMIVLDTTGSMADELAYLRDQLGSIVANVTLEHAAVDIRFALVVYRDEGDEYVVRSFPFTSSLESIQDSLDAQVAFDGGDFPEAMDRALGEALAASWRSGNTARVALVVADAPPHQANYAATLERIKEARAAGIQLYALAASGVDPSAEYILRAGAALTGARYMFLTDDSGVGNAHAEPHVLCYQVTVLSNLISRVISSELEGRRVEAAPEAVVRTVGNVSGGVCVEPAGGDETPVSVYLPTGSGDYADRTVSAAGPPAPFFLGGSDAAGPSPMASSLGGGAGLVLGVLIIGLALAATAAFAVRRVQNRPPSTGPSPPVASPWRAPITPGQGKPPAP